MKVSADDFRRVYENMNDDALLAVNREELVEVAQQCFDAELQRRGLAAAEEEEELALAAAAIPAESEGMVDLATFTNVDDARMARALLKAADIPCYLQNDDQLAGNLITQPGGGAFRLTVAPEYLDEAREILDSEISEEELAAQAEAAGELELEEELEAEKEEE